MKQSQVRDLIAYIREAGQRIVRQAGHIEDIGVKKRFLTVEDLRIERDIKALVEAWPTPSRFYAEEENDRFVDAPSLWVVDPISGTKLFIEGRPHYAIVASHLRGGQVDFAAVYDPSADRMYLADEDGAFINAEPLRPHPASGPGTGPIAGPSAPAGRPSPLPAAASIRPIILALSPDSPHAGRADALRRRLAEAGYALLPSQGSFAVNYCMAAEGLFGGVVSLTKDAFPEFAGCFIARRAGLRASNLRGEADISPDDRAFVCGGEAYDALLHIVREAVLSGS